MTEPGRRALPEPAAHPTPTVDDEPSYALERSIGRLLTVGTYVSIALLVVGFALLLAAGIGPLSGGPAFDAGRIVGDVAAALPAGFIWLGLLVVIATPTARVLASLIGYARRGEQGMVAIAAAILVVIAVSVTLGQLEG